MPRGGERKGAGRKKGSVKKSPTKTLTIRHDAKIIEQVRAKFKGCRGEFNSLGKKWLESLLHNDK